jgi:hypothetical protein
MRTGTPTPVSENRSHYQRRVLVASLVCARTTHPCFPQQVALAVCSADRSALHRAQLLRTERRQREAPLLQQRHGLCKCCRRETNRSEAVPVAAESSPTRCRYSFEGSWQPLVEERQQALGPRRGQKALGVFHELRNTRTEDRVLASAYSRRPDAETHTSGRLQRSRRFARSPRCCISRRAAPRAQQLEVRPSNRPRTQPVWVAR